MKIKIRGYFDFTDRSDDCCENGDLSILYEVPKAWEKWSVEKKQEWLIKNESKLEDALCGAMCVVARVDDAEDIEEYGD